MAGENHLNYVIKIHILHSMKIGFFNNSWIFEYGLNIWCVSISWLSCEQPWTVSMTFYTELVHTSQSSSSPYNCDTFLRLQCSNVEHCVGIAAANNVHFNQTSRCISVSVSPPRPPLRLSSAAGLIMTSCPVWVNKVTKRHEWSSDNSW